MASPGGSKIFQWDSTILNHATSFHSYGQALFLLLIFFSLVVLIFTFFLYARWICGQRLLSTAAAAAAAANATAAPSPPGLDPDTINSLPIILHRSVVAKSKEKHGFIAESECSICLGVFEDEEKLKVLPECNHAYHSECVDNWLFSQSSCPLCRASLSPSITMNSISHLIRQP
ncbi:hypothetical protein DITRI_Ditri14bG0088200 [Diplodiscus trichospermus]